MLKIITYLTVQNLHTYVRNLWLFTNTIIYSKYREKGTVKQMIV